MIERGFFGIEVPQRVHNKWLDYLGKGRIPAGRELGTIFLRSVDVHASPALRQAVCFVLRLTDPSSVWIRSAQQSGNFTLVFIGQGSVLKEICSWRALRQMAKAWQHKKLELGEITSPAEGQQFHRIYKYKHRSKIQGGLIKQETQPRDRWKNA